MADVFNTLNAINVNEHTEKKNGLTYLSWAWAWGEVKKRYPDASYRIYENEAGWFYHTDGRSCWVKTGVTINGQELIEYLPVMDFKNKSIPDNAVTSFDVNKAIQRSLTKAIARHGLGLYIYAGEDLPEDEAEAKAEENPKEIKQTKVSKNDPYSAARKWTSEGISTDFVLKLYGYASLEEMPWSKIEHALNNIEQLKKRQAEAQEGKK